MQTSAPAHCGDGSARDHDDSEGRADESAAEDGQSDDKTPVSKPELWEQASSMRESGWGAGYQNEGQQVFGAAV